MHKVQRTLLLVDNAQEDRAIIRRALHQDVNMAYHLLEAENGAQALAYLRQQQPDCLLLACELPDTDGVILLQTVMQQAAPHLYPVVMLADANSSALAAAAMEQGAHDFLSKDALRAEQVQRAVNNAIEKVALLRQLEEQRAWSQRALASVSEAVITTDAEGCIIFMNPTAEALTGWNAGAAQGQALDQIFRLYDETTRQPVAAIANGGLSHQQLVGHVTPALLVGESRPTVAIEYSVAPIHNRLGNPLGAVITFRDVSARKTAEEALSKSEARLNTILQNIPLSVYMLTTDQRYLYVNRHYEQLADVTNAEIQGKSIYEMFPLETAIALSANDQRALAAKAPLELEEFALHEGELRTYASIKTPLLDANGEPYAIVGISTDITERRRDERNRQLLNDIGLTLSKTNDADALMAAVASQVGEFFAAFRCGFADVDLAGGTSTLHRDWCAAHAASMAGTYHIADFIASEFMATLAADQAVFVSDVRQDARTAAYAANWAAFGIAAFVFVPIFRAGVWKALFFVHLETPQPWRADEIQLLHDVASRVWPAVERARSEEELRLSERRLKLALEAGNMVAWEWNPHTNQIVTTDNFHSLYGLSVLTGAEAGFALVHPDDSAPHEAKVQHVARNGGMYHSEFRIHRADTGQQIWLEEWGYGILDEAEQVEMLVGIVRDITNRKVAEQQLAFHASLLDYAYDAVVATDAEQNITVWNRGAEQMYGWQAAEVIGRRSVDLLQSGMTAAQRDAALRQMQAGNRFKTELTVHHRDGAPILIEGHTVAMRDEAGLITGYMSISRDISERRRAEEALRTSEAQLNAILYNIPASVYILTTDHRYLLVNRIYEQENNISNAEIHGQSVYDRWSPQLAAAWVANEQKVLATKTTISVEETVPRDGETRVYATLKAPLLNAAGEPYAVIGISTDITERKRTEEALRRREEQLRAIINAVPGLIAYVDQNERYQFVNATYSQWFARPLEAIEGHTVQALGGIEPYQQGRQRLAQVLAGQEVKTEATFTYPDGVTRTLLVNYIPHLDAAGQPQGFYVVDTDISERKQAEALLRQQADLLDQAHDAIIVWELGGVIRYWNRGAEAMYGWTNAEALGQVTHQLLQTQHPLALPEFEQILRSVGQWMGEVRHIKRNGQQLVVESRYVVTRQADDVYLVLETNRDISERKQVQEALRASEERYRTLFETMDEGFCVIEMLFDEAGKPVDYRFLEANPTFERFTGLEDAVGKTARHLVPELESHWFEIYGHVALTGEPRRFVEGSEAMGRWFDVYAFRFGGAESRRVALLFNNITERKQAEDQLRSQEELLRQIADNVPGLIGYIGADEEYRFVNATFETWFQRPRQQIIGHTVRELIGEEERARLSQYRQQALAGEMVSYETLFAYPDGVTRTVWGRYQPHLAVDGTVPGFYLFVMDITERKQAEEALRQQHALLQNVINSTPTGIYVRDLQGRYLLVNRLAATIVGLTPKQMIGHYYQALYPASTVANIAEEDRRVLAHGQMENEEFEWTPDGVTHTLHSIRLPYRDAENNIAGILNVMHDITAHKRAEEALRASEVRFRQLAEAMPQIVWVCDADGAITYINEQWQVYSGISFAQTLEHGMWPALHPDDQVSNRTRWQHALQSDQSYEAELRLRRADGEYRWHLERAVPIRNAAGVIDQWFGASFDIDDHKRAQDALARANERFALAENASNGWVYDFDVQLWRAERSPGFSRILGYAPAEISPDVAWWHSLFHPEDRPLIANQTVRTRDDAEFTEVEYRIRHRDGHYIHLLDRSRNIHNAAGQRVRVVGITVDISERKRAELHQHFLSTLGMQLRLLSDIDTIIAHLVQRVGEHLMVSGCRVNEIDLAQNQFIVQKDWAASGTMASGVYPLAELAPPALLAELQAGHTIVVDNTMTDSRTAPVSHHYRTNQTTAFIGVPIFRQGQWSATLSVRTQGERRWRPDEIALLETVANQFQPLLEKVRAEQALRHSEERLRLALEGGGLGIWEWHIPTDTATWTEQEYALFGLAPNTPITRALFASLIHIEDRAEFLATMDRLAVQGGDFAGEFRIIHPNGEVRWLAERCVAIADAQGQPERVLGVNFDITERKATEHALQQFNEQLEYQVKERTVELTRRLQELDQFAYVASHDLKAPLRAIDHLAQWISVDAADLLPPASRDHLEKMRGRIVRMEKLLDDLLAYSRADRYQYNLGKVDVAVLLDDIVRLVTPPQGFAVSLQTALPILITQKVPLETVLRNLINNAIKHHNRTDGQVQVAVRDLGEFFEFSVSDDGPGIEPEFHERIFQIFQTLRPRDKVEGSGMGLAIVKKIVESRNGHISVTSTPGLGATFRFTWPKE